MSTPLHRAAIALVAWTLFVWGNRVANALEADEGSGALVLPAVMALAAVGSVAALWRARRAGTLDGPGAAVLRALPVLTVVIWLVRGIDIAISGHGAAFVAVHLALAVISVALSAWVWRQLPSPTWSVAATAK